MIRALLFVGKLVLVGSIGQEVFRLSCIATTTASLVSHEGLKMLPLTNAASSPTAHEDYKDPLGAFMRGTEWREKVGARTRIVREQLFTEPARFMCVLKCILIGAMEELSHFYFGAQKRRKQHTPALMYDIISDVHSPVTVVLQFLSACLQVPLQPCLLLLLAVSKVSSFEALSEHHPERADAFRVGSVAAATVATLRHLWRFKQWPFPLAIVPDRRRTREEKVATLTTFVAGCDKCPDPGFGARIRARCPTVAALLSTGCEKAIADWVEMHDLMNAPCEVRHARSKRSISTSSRASLMLAKGVLSDATFRANGGEARLS